MGAFYVEEFAGVHVVDVAVDGDGFGDERVIADAGDIVEDRLLLVLDGEPFDEFAGARAGAFANIAKAVGSKLGGFEAGIEKVTHGVVGKELHAAIGVMNDEEFAGAKKFVADDQGTDGVVAGTAASIANNVGIAFRESGKLCGVEARVHASENGEMPRRRNGEFGFVAEIGGVFGVGFQDFRENLAHDVLLAI